MPPRLRGLVHSLDRESCFDLNIAKQFLSDAQAESLSKGLVKTRFIKNINMSDCGLDDNKLIKIISTIDPYMITSLDLSNNPKLTKKSYDKIAELMWDKKSNLTSLKLEGNKIGDTTF